MAHQPPVDEFGWLSISRPRRLTLGDLMVGVAVTALTCLTVTVTLRSSLDNGADGSPSVSSRSSFSRCRPRNGS